MNELVFVQTTESVKAHLPKSNALFVTDETVYALYTAFFPESTLVLPSGEGEKTLASLEKIYRALIQHRIDRQGAVVAVGGGVMGDLAGFAAATYMRGVSFYTVPTTLLAQIDSAIGGKTAVDFDNLKNLVGAFKMPRKIVVCPEFLETLPAREWRCGLGELLKTALLSEEIFAFVAKHIQKIAAREAAAVEQAVRLCAAFKKGVTDRDPTEQGERKILNLGHTVGHALEACDGHKESHGEYILTGLVLEAAITDATTEAKRSIAALLAAVPPLSFDYGAKEVLHAALSDKKNAGGKISVLRLKSVGKIEEAFFSPEEFAARYEAARRESGV